MNAVNDLLDKYREACSLASDSALADSLKLTRQGVHQWRKGTSWPSEEHIIAMAKKINEPAERWFVAINADRAGPEGRKIWLRLAQVAASIIAVYTAIRFGAHSHETLAFAPFAFIHYAKLLCCSLRPAWPQTTTGATMRGLWSESNWRLEHDALILPNGRRLTLAGIRQWQVPQLIS